MSVTIARVAKEAKVSVATVSRVINNPEKVKEETRLIVEEVIKDLNYSPNAMARALVTKETRTIGVIIPDINNLFYPAVVRGIQDGVSKIDYQAIFCSTDNNIEEEKKYIKSLVEKRVDAFIILGSRKTGHENNEHLVELAEKHPVVLVNDYIENSKVYSVMTDEVSGAYKAVDYLISLGHKDIVHITVEPNFTTMVNKLEGYKLALKENNFEYDEDKVFNATSYTESGNLVMNEIIDKGLKPTAIFAGNDQIAIGVISSILSHGLRVPEDISVIGYSDIPIAKSIYPSLTTVGQFPHKTGKMSVDVAIKLINNKTIENQKVVLEPDFIVRGSTREVRK